MEKESRCVVCGKLLEEGQEAVQVLAGRVLRSGEVGGGSLWGRAHRRCFNRIIPLPKAALDELRRLAAA